MDDAKFNESLYTPSIGEILDRIQLGETTVYDYEVLTNWITEIRERIDLAYERERQFTYEHLKILKEMTDVWTNNDLTAD